MTAKFVSAADLMARALGAEGFRYVAVEHPISSASEAALSAEAARTLAEGREILGG